MPIWCQNTSIHGLTADTRLARDVTAVAVWSIPPSFLLLSFHCQFQIDSSGGSSKLVCLLQSITSAHSLQCILEYFSSCFSFNFFVMASILLALSSTELFVPFFSSCAYWQVLLLLTQNPLPLTHNTIGTLHPIKHDVASLEIHLPFRDICRILNR